MSNIKKYEQYIKNFEANNFTQQEIIDKFIKVLAYSRDFDEYVSNMYDINDVLNWNGYHYQFVVPRKEGTAYKNIDYVNKIEKITMSKNKTKELIMYLNEVSDYRLTLSSLQRLKIEFLMELDILPKDNDIINQYSKRFFYDLYFEHYDNLELRNILDNSFIKLGLKWIECDYMRFRMDMEYVLYSMNFNEKYETYKRINTIKVGLNICPRTYFVWNDKNYYNEKIASNINKYLKKLDKDIVKKYKNKYKNCIDNLDDTGYKLLYNML